MRKQLRILLFAVALINAFSGLFISSPVQAAVSGYRYADSNTSNSIIIERYTCESASSSNCSSIRVFNYEEGTKYVFSGVETTERPTITVNGSQPSRGVVKGGSDNGKTVTITNTARFISQFPNATAPPPAVEDANTKRVTVTVTGTYESKHVGSKATVSDDTITLKKADNSVIQTQTAQSQSDEIKSTQVEFKGQFTNVEPGTYKVCSEKVLKGKCDSNVIKVSGAVKSVSLSGTADPSTLTPAGSTGNKGNQCGGGFVLKWVVCPILTSINDVIKFIFDEVVVKLLVLTPLDTGGTAESLYNVWKNFRDLANVIFVLIFLFIIFGNASGIGMDAYTFKKALPRLVAAVIAVQASFLLMGILVDAGNVLGGGIASLAQTAASQGQSGTNNAVQNTTGVVFGAAAAATAAIIVTAAAAWPIVLVAFLGLLISIVGFVITLVARVLIIDVLIILSPIAITAWVLPNTERYFKMWFDNLVKAVLMYPLMVLIMSIAHVIAAANASFANQGGNGTNLGAAFISLLAPMIAFAMMPATFKFAGQAVGFATQSIAKRTAGVNKKLDPLRETSRRGMKEKNALRLGDENAKFLGSKKLGQGMARIGSGNAFSFGAIGKRKIAASRAEAQSAQRKDFDEMFARETPTNKDLGTALMSGKLNGKKMSSQQFQAGLDRLMRNGGAPEYAQLYQKYQNSEGKFDAAALASDLGVSEMDAKQLWANAHAGANGAWAAGKGFNPKGFAKFNEEKGAGVASYEGARAREFVQQTVSSNPPKLLQVLKEITEDSTSRTKVSDGFIDELFKNKSALAGQSFNINGRDFRDLDDFISQGYLATGQVADTTPGAAPGATRTGGIGLGAVLPP